VYIYVVYMPLKAEEIAGYCTDYYSMLNCNQNVTLNQSFLFLGENYVFTQGCSDSKIECFKVLATVVCVTNDSTVSFVVQF